MSYLEKEREGEKCAGSQFKYGQKNVCVGVSTALEMAKISLMEKNGNDVKRE